jgi:molybdenum cofactor synthesis domain-containing protein
MTLEAKVLTVSDSVQAGTRRDRSGPAIGSFLTDHGFAVIAFETTADGITSVSTALHRLSDGFSGLVVTTGGTGFAPTDLTPEGTLAVLERQAPGLAEAARAASPLGRLSRGVAGTVGDCLIVNLPGSEAGALESIGSVVDLLPHALDLLAGGHPH